MLKSSIATSALLACTLATAGCTPSDGLAKDALAKKADAICAKYNPKVRAIGDPDLSDLPASDKAFTKLYKVSLDLRDKLGELDPDGDVEPQWTRVLDRMDTTRNSFGQFASAARNKDAATARQIAATVKKNGEASDRALDDFGARRCGSDNS